MKIFNIVVLCTIVHIFFIQNALSEEIKSTPVLQNKLNPIIVSGSRQRQNLLDSISSVSIIDKEEIRRSGAKNVGDLLKGTSGVEIGQSGGLGSVTSFFLRGADSRNALVLIDGVRVRDSITQSSLAENIPLSLINKIEIVRGNVSSLYGDGAVGGVINIFTKPEFDDLNSKLEVFKNISAEYGSHNTFDTSFGIFKRNKKLSSFSLQAQHLKTDGFSATNPKITGSSDESDYDDDKYRNSSLNMSLNKKFSQFLIGGKVYYTDANTSFDNSFYGKNPQQRAEHEIYNIFFEENFLKNMNSRIDYDESVISLKYNYGEKIKTRQSQLRFSSNFSLNEIHSFVFGYESRNEQRNPISSGLSSRDTGSLFAGYLAKFKKYTFQLNIRNDEYDKFNGETTWFVGGSYRLNENKNFFINKSTAYGIPTAYAISTNTNLLPENHNSSEIGITYNHNKYNFRIVYFDTETNNPITFDPSDSYKAKNFKSFKNNGLEVTSVLNFQDNLVKLSWTLQDPETPFGFDTSKNVQSARRARSFGSVSWDFIRESYELGVKSVYSSARFDSDYSNVRLDDYLVFSVRGEFKFNKKLSLFVKGENITNENYQLANGYITSPSSIYFGVSYNE